MKQSFRIVSIVLTGVFALATLPLPGLAEGTRSYTHTEQPETGVTIYYNKDGSQTMVVEPYAETEVVLEEPGRLLDAGARLVGEETAARVEIKKCFEENETLVTVGMDGASVSFYPVVAEEEAAQERETPAPKGDVMAAETAGEITSGTIEAFVGYEAPQPLERRQVPAGTPS